MGVGVRCESRQERKWHLALHGSFRRKQKSPLFPLLPSSCSFFLALGVGTKRFDLGVSVTIALRSSSGCERVVHVAGNPPCLTLANFGSDILHPCPILRELFVFAFTLPLNGIRGLFPCSPPRLSSSLGRIVPQPMGRFPCVGEADATQPRLPQPLWPSSPAAELPNPPGASSSSTSVVCKQLQLNESLQLLGAVLSMLRLTLTLLGRRPFGRGTEDFDPSPALFRRLCSLLDFLEDARELRRQYSGNIGKAGGGGVIAGTGGGAVTAGGASAFGRSYPTR